MPLAEVAGGVALFFKNRSDGDLGRFKHALHREGDAKAVGIAPGVATSAGGGTHCSAGVKAGKSHSFGLHLVEVGSLEVRVTIVASIAPALVIGHDEDDVGPICRLKRCGDVEQREDECFQEGEF